MRIAPVSTVIPTYNRVEFLERAIVSVARQTVRCDEIIIVDDGSTDNTKNLIENLISQGLEIKYLYQENKGPAAARNLGIVNCRNEYVAFLDSDDHFHKKKIELQYNAFIKNKDYYISHTYETWFRRGEHLNQKKIHIPQHGMIFDHCLQLCAVGMSTVMVKKTLFDEVGLFDEELRCCEDYDLWLRVSHKYPFLLVPEKLTKKEGGRGDQVSYQYRVGMDRLRIKAIKNLLNSNKLQRQDRDSAVLELIKKAEIYGNGCMKHNNPEEGKLYLDLASNHRKQLEN